MIPAHDLLIFAAACLLLVLTPGPNMIYLISRSICQGRRAGVTSLIGVVTGFFVHMFAALVYALTGNFREKVHVAEAGDTAFELLGDRKVGAVAHEVPAGPATSGHGSRRCTTCVGPRHGWPAVGVCWYLPVHL